jgi:hypothetical protein
MSQISGSPFLQGRRPGGEFLSGTQLADAVQSQPLQVFDVPATGAIQRSSLPNDMLEAFGLVGQVVATAGNVAARERAQEDQAQSGLGSKAFSLDGVDLADDIENGRVTLPPGAKPSEFATQFVDSLIETRYADRPEAWKNAYRANAPRVAEALQNKRQRDIERGRATAVDGLKDAAFRAKTPDEVLQAVNSAKALGLSDREAVASVVVPSLKSAALLGDTATFDRLASQIPEGEFTQTVQLERLRLQSTRANIETASQTNALAMFEEVATSQPPEVAAETLRQMTESGTLSAVNAAKAQQFLADRQNEYVAAAASNALNSLTSGVRSGALNVGDAMRQIDSIEATVGVRAANSMREAMRSALSEQLEAQQQQAENAARNEMLSEYRTQFQSGAAVSVFEDSERQVGKKTVKVGGDDAARILMSEEFARIDATARTPEEAAYQKVQSVANRAYAPADWVAPLKMPYMAAGSIEKMETLPPSWENSLTTYAIMRRTQPHLTTTVLSDNERAFYDSVLAFMPSTTTGGRTNALQAFKQAYAARTRSPEDIAQLTRNISDNDVQKAALGVVNKDTWFASLRGEGVQSAPRNIGNLSELQTAIKSEAERLVRAGQASPTLAIEQAKNTVSSSGSVINGFWTLTNVEGLPEPVRKDLPAIGQQLIDDYKTTNKDVDKAGLSYNRSTGTWEIVDFLGLPVEGPANKTKFRNGDLIRIHNERLQKEADAAELKAVQRNAGMQAERRRVATDPILTDRIQGLLN